MVMLTQSVPTERHGDTDGELSLLPAPFHQSHQDLRHVLTLFIVPVIDMMIDIALTRQFSFP